LLTPSELQLLRISLKLCPIQRWEIVMKATCVLLLTLFVLGCGGGYGSGGGGGGGGALHIDTLVPNLATAGGPAFTLTVNGTGFTANSVVYWNTTTRTTHFVMANQVTADIPASDIANAGSASVYVRTTGGVYGGGANSNSVPFTIN
jgi:IPT/TIG domain